MYRMLPEGLIIRNGIFPEPVKTVVQMLVVKCVLRCSGRCTILLNLAIIFGLIIRAGIHTDVYTSQGFDFKAAEQGGFQRRITQEVVGYVRVLICLNPVKGIVIF